ncbi:MAG: adenine deaminase [Promethearchaeati archaeon]
MNNSKYLKELIAVSTGDQIADVLIKNIRLINTFNGEIEETNIALYKDRIAGIGDYTQSKEEIDIDNDFLAPNFIDGHTHLESSMLHPLGYTKAVIPKGISTIVTDLHELANIAGIEGIEFVLEWSDKLPMDIILEAPSCVPSTDYETSGAEINENDIKELLDYKNVIGLGEMMSFPAVIQGNEDTLKKILIAKDKIIDGHAPELNGKELNAYISAGIRSEHESTTLQEAKEKLRKGMYIMIREGSSEKNLEALLPLVDENTYNRCMFITDDRTCSDLLREGGVDHIVRKAIKFGLDPIRAIQLATINPANYFNLRERGLIAPGFLANMFTFKDLNNINANLVFYRGKLVAQNGNSIFKAPPIQNELTDTFDVKDFSKDSLKINTNKIQNGSINYPVIKIIPHQIITEKIIKDLQVSDGIILPDPKNDILKLVVIERHKATGNIGKGFVKGFGLKKGALASSIAHDSHNIICVGYTDKAITIAVEKIRRLNGGLVVANNDHIISNLPLPIAGLLSPKPLKKVVVNFEKLEKAAHQLGDLPDEPFSILSFLGLAVIPELRLTDRGYFDLTEI